MDGPHVIIAVDDLRREGVRGVCRLIRHARSVHLRGAGIGEDQLLRSERRISALARTCGCTFGASCAVGVTAWVVLGGGLAGRSFAGSLLVVASAFAGAGLFGKLAMVAAARAALALEIWRLSRATSRAQEITRRLEHEV